MLCASHVRAWGGRSEWVGERMKSRGARGGERGGGWNRWNAACGMYILVVVRCTVCTVEQDKYLVNLLLVLRRVMRYGVV